MTSLAPGLHGIIMDKDPDITNIPVITNISLSLPHFGVGLRSSFVKSQILYNCSFGIVHSPLPPFPPLPLSLDQTEARRAEKRIYWVWAPLFSFLRVWMTAYLPRPPCPVIWRPGSATVLIYDNRQHAFANCPNSINSTFSFLPLGSVLLYFIA